MLLNADQFESIIKALRGDLSTDDRRQMPRVGISATTYLLQPGGRWEPVRIRDLSQGGVGITFSRHLNPGDNFYIRLSSRNASLFILCQVRHCREKASNYLIGASFIKIGCDEPAALPEPERILTPRADPSPHAKDH